MLKPDPIARLAALMEAAHPLPWQADLSVDGGIDTTDGQLVAACCAPEARAIVAIVNAWPAIRRVLEAARMQVRDDLQSGVRPHPAIRDALAALDGDQPRRCNGGGVPIPEYAVRA